MANEYVSFKTQLASVVANVSGIRQSPTNPNETQNDYPFAAIYLMRANTGKGSVGTGKALYTIAIDVLTPRLDLANDLAILDPFIDSIPLALTNEVSDNGDRFSGTISTFEDIDISYIVTDYNGVPVRGYRFQMNNVKILTNQ